MAVCLFGACGDRSGSGSSTPAPSSAGAIDTSRYTPVVDLTFDAASIDGDRISVPNRGQLGVDITVESVNDGTVSLVPGPEQGRSLKFPGLGSTATPPRAILAIRPSDADGNVDSLTPRERPFEFGAQFRLDGESEGRDDDDGNNLVQRGLAADLSQYKIQVDHGHASCRIAGDRGDVVLKSRVEIEPDEWYDVRCSRDGSTVVLRLHELGDTSTDTVRGTGELGAVAPPPDTPLAVGGKATDSGQLVVRKTDQFNGDVHSVFLAIEDAE